MYSTLQSLKQSNYFLHTQTNGPTISGKSVCYNLQTEVKLNGSSQIALIQMMLISLLLFLLVK